MRRLQGKSAEEVGKEAVKKLSEDYERGAVDRHAADMLLPYMALAKRGRIQVAEITDHVIHNISVVEKFLDVKFKIEGKKGEPGTISLG